MNEPIIKALQNEFPLEERPFKALADQAGISEAELIKEIKKLQTAGAIRKFGAILKHQNAGYGSNAMVAFDVPNEMVEETGNRISSFAEVSHCYERPRFDNFNYNLYAMTHGTSVAGLEKTVQKIAQTIGIDAYQILWSIKEFKKTSPKFF